MKFENEHLTRQLDLIPIEVLGENITIIGAGAIGSFTALALAKMGFANITVFDHDTIDVENMNSQFYRFSDIGKPKVKALTELVESFTQVKITGVHDKYSGGKVLPGIVISAVDSMAARKMIWDTHKGKAPMTKSVIDARMGAETALLYSMDPMNKKDIAAYDKTLYTDESAVRERCTAKATMYTACMLSGMVAKVVKEIAVKSERTRVLQWSIKDDAFQAWRAQ